MSWAWVWDVPKIRYCLYRTRADFKYSLILADK
jgi:hypothetical protein